MGAFHLGRIRFGFGRGEADARFLEGDEAPPPPLITSREEAESLAAWNRARRGAAPRTPTAREMTALGLYGGVLLALAQLDHAIEGSWSGQDGSEFPREAGTPAAAAAEDAFGMAWMTLRPERFEVPPGSGAEIAGPFWSFSGSATLLDSLVRRAEAGTLTPFVTTDAALRAPAEPAATEPQRMPVEMAVAAIAPRMEDDAAVPSGAEATPRGPAPARAAPAATAAAEEAAGAEPAPAAETPRLAATLATAAEPGSPAEAVPAAADQKEEGQASAVAKPPREQIAVGPAEVSISGPDRAGQDDGGERPGEGSGPAPRNDARDVPGGPGDGDGLALGRDRDDRTDDRGDQQASAGRDREDRDDDRGGQGSVGRDRDDEEDDARGNAQAARGRDPDDRDDDRGGQQASVGRDRGDDDDDARGNAQAARGRDRDDDEDDRWLGNALDGGRGAPRGEARRDDDDARGGPDGGLPEQALAAQQPQGDWML